MVVTKEINNFVNAYCTLRDRQIATYCKYAKIHRLTVNELFVLDILWFTPNGCTQKEICKRLSSNKQTINAIISRFNKQGYLLFIEVEKDRRNRLIVLSENGKAYAKSIILPAADAENLAMADIPIVKIAELINLTTQFTENMEKRFSEIKED